MSIRPLTRLFRGTGRFVAAHLLFAFALAGAVGVRVIAAHGYPAPLWGGDSYGYLHAAIAFRPHIGRPSGYSVFLRGLEPFHDFGMVVAAQAALGALVGVMVYALVWRHVRAAFPRWILLPGVPATAAAILPLYDGNTIQLEHMMLADSLFTFLLMASVTVVLWRPRVSWWTGALAGALIGCAAVTRLAGLPLLALIVLALLLRWSGWRRTLAAVLAAGAMFAVPFLAYMKWYDDHWGKFTVSSADNVWMYGRVMAFADCAKIKPAPQLAVMCPKNPPSDPALAPAFRALWTQDSPFATIPGGIYGEQGNRMAGEFADAAVKAQPRDYVDTVVRDTFRAFKGGERQPYPTPWTYQNLRFPPGEEWSDEEALLAEQYGGRTGEIRVVEPDAGWIRGYQDRWYTPGPLLGGLMAAGLVGVVIRLRPRGRWGGSVLLPWSMAAALLVIPAATADFDYRYIPPAIPFAALAAVLALVPGVRRPQPAPEPVDVPADEPADEPAEADGTDGTDETDEVEETQDDQREQRVRSASA